MAIKKFLIGLFIIALPMAGYSEESSAEKMMAELDTVKSILEIQYAPAEWKHNYSGWDLDKAIEIAKYNLVFLTPYPSVQNFQAVLKFFFFSMKDYHVGAAFHRTECATLPFSVYYVDERFFIIDVDRSKLSYDMFPIEEGDELVIFDDKPAHQAVNEYKVANVGQTNEETDIRIAAYRLTFRSAAAGNLVPKGPIVIGVKSKKTGEVHHFQLIWTYYPENINYDKIKTPPMNCIWNKEFLPAFMKVKEPIERRRTSYDVGAKKSFIPPLGNVLWESDKDNCFYAYIFEGDDGKQYGYIRIPSYIQIDTKKTLVEHAADFEQLINYLEQNTESLVIDQINNPGGSVFYLYALASMLTDKPLYTPKHKMSITAEDVAEALFYIDILEKVKTDEDAREIFGDSYDGYPISYQLAQFQLDFCRFIVNEWNEGKFLTDPYHILGVDRINPHPRAHYSKPVVLLVNHLCFSGGDFFPAIMQDNQRMKIFGTRTAGAGGYVKSASYPNKYGIWYFHYSASIAERVDKNPIENLGVVPDVEYKLTVDDIENDFGGYRQAILDALN